MIYKNKNKAGCQGLNEYIICGIVTQGIVHRKENNDVKITCINKSICAKLIL
jgi:hypothetical protein